MGGSATISLLTSYLFHTSAFAMVTNPDHKANLSLEALANLQVPSDLCISPDTAKIVYKLEHFSMKGRNATSSIWIAEVGKERSTRQFTSGLFNDQQPQWSPDGTAVAFKSDRGHLGKTSTIYGMPIGSMCWHDPISRCLLADWALVCQIQGVNTLLFHRLNIKFSSSAFSPL